MSNSARENILSKLRDSAPVKAFDASDFSVLDEKKAAQADKIEQYKRVTQAVNTKVFEVSQDNLMTSLKQLLKEKGTRHLMYGPSTDLAKDLESNWDLDETKLVPYDQDVESCKEFLFEVDGAITTTLGAIAETGSLMVWPTKEEPRLLSLTPPLHIAIVKADMFYTTFHEAIEVNNWSTNMPTNALLISGPSKTADIEQELCYGVHGPKELIVYIVT